MKRIVLLLLVLLLAGALYYYTSDANDVNKQATSGMDLSDRTFAIENEEDIHKIVITSTTAPKYTMIRQSDDSWIFNEYFKADRHIMVRVLEALTKIDIRYIPPQAAQEVIAKQMDRDGIEVQVYDKSGVKLRDFIVGGNAKDELATFFKVKGKEKAYAMHFPYSEGSIRKRFQYKLMDLRDKYIMEQSINDIMTVSVDYPKQRDHSFILTREQGPWEVLPILDGVEPNVNPINERAINAFLSEFKSIPSESIETENPRIDSINSVVPFCVVHVITKDGQKKMLSLRPMIDFLDGSVDTRSVDEVHAVERFFVETNWRDNYLLQKRQIVHILRPYNYFFN